MSTALEHLLRTHRAVHGFLTDQPCCAMVIETLGQVEVGCRALGWRLVICTCPDASMRINLTTADGFEISAAGPSLLGCFLEPHTARKIDDHYKAAVADHLKKG